MFKNYTIVLKLQNIIIHFFITNKTTTLKHFKKSKNICLLVDS